MSAKQIITPALRAAVHVRSSKLNAEVSKSSAAYLSSAPLGGKHVLPDLPYDYAALEREFRVLLLLLSTLLLRIDACLPNLRLLTHCTLNNPNSASISAETMEIHHSKHHNTYVTNLNASLEKLDAAVSSGDVSSIISLQGALKFNGGGHLNHTLFWENLCSKGSSEFPTSGALKEAVDARFGDFETMKKDFSAMTVGVQGSGWGWLGFDAKTGKIYQTSNCWKSYY